MFGFLFAEDAGEYSTCLTESDAALGTNLPCPPLPRPSTGLCGIGNRGATCYLNSLLQTLLFTPEFRERLFALLPEELGKLDDASLPHSKVRVIPIQMQRLFARLLLSDQQSVSTVELTDSFGWTNSEELQQHDVQELNRILFCAIEDSLVGTSGQTLISHLYKGTTVNQIICQQCGRVSEREEHFLDLSLPIVDGNSVETALLDMYVSMETMDGNNQYKCERCNKLVDAKMGAKLRSLPPILTISLLRFSFDFVKLERYKETGRFAFPMTLDMSPFCENPVEEEYELFSVVIHQGSTHGGHYHAYIRDVDCIGTWSHPEEEQIQMPSDPADGKQDFIDCDSPVDLMANLLSRSPTGGMTLDQLCAELVKQTGVSWNKRFKKKYGPINKFFKKNPDRFSYDDVSSSVFLISVLASPAPSVNNTSHKNDEPKSARSDEKPAPPVGHCWFDLNDSRVHPITADDIEQQFSGRESAYMLFYRNRKLTRPIEAMSNSSYGLTQSLIDLVRGENERLDQERIEYDEAINRLELKIHFSENYSYHDGALHVLDNGSLPVSVTLDRRKTVDDLRELIRSQSPSQEWTCIHTMRNLAAGFHLYDEVSSNDTAILKDVGVVSGSDLYCWNGSEMNGLVVPTGKATEPVLIEFILDNTMEGEHKKFGVSKCATVKEMCNILKEIVGFDPMTMQLSRKVIKDDSVTLQPLCVDDMCKAIQDMSLNDNDCLFIQKASRSKSEQIISVDASSFRVAIENRVEEHAGETSKQTYLEIQKSTLVQDVKSRAVDAFSVALVTVCRLRLEDPNLGFGPPLHELQSVADAGIKPGASLVLERGLPPTDNQISLTFGMPDINQLDMDVIIERNSTILSCLETMTSMAGLCGEEWHLRKTNWCGEEDAMLDDLELTLEQCNIRDGNRLLLKKGRLPPKGQLCLPVWLYSPEGTSPDKMMWIKTFLESQQQNSMTDSQEMPKLIRLGEVEIGKLCTLLDLKILILSLEAMAAAPVPSVDFLRVRLQEKCRPTAVLRNSNQTLQRLKVTNSSEICVQLLPHEEDLRPNQLLVTFCRRIPTSRCYGPPQEVVWDVSKGVGVEPLRRLACDMFIIPAEHVSLAKHFPSKHEWLEISNQVVTHKNKKKKAAKQCSVNLKQAPYYIHEGDIIGVKDLRLEAKAQYHDFATSDDEQALEKLRREIEEKKQMRRNKKSNMGPSNDKNSRPEVGITIKVGNFQ